MKRSAEARVDLYGPLTIATGNQQTAAVGRNFVQSGGTIWAIALAFVACLLPSGVLTTHGYHGAADPVQTSSSYQTPSMEQSSFSDPVARQPSGDKITILPGHAADYSEATFCLMEEDHTLGNALRWMIMKNPDVEFCGYSAPHPSEPKIHLRIQMYDNLSAITCLFEALANLRNLFSSIDDAYNAALADEDYVVEDDTDIKARVAAIAQEAAERRARGTNTAGGDDVVMGDGTS